MNYLLQLLQLMPVFSCFDISLVMRLLHLQKSVPDISYASAYSNASVNWDLDWGYRFVLSVRGYRLVLSVRSPQKWIVLKLPDQNDQIFSCRSGSESD